MAGVFSRKTFCQVLAVLWLVQVGWLAWHFAPDVADLAQRLASGRTGEAVRREEPFFQWLKHLQALMPPQSTYIFVDCYEAGKDIEARYFLYPRRIVRLHPTATPSVLYDKIKQERADFLVLRECNLYPQWQFLFAKDHPLFQACLESGPGLVFRVEHQLVRGGFYD